MKKNFIKVITLASFVFLIGVFVVYRSGLFGQETNSVPMSPNGSVITSKSKDSTQVKDSIIPRRTLISSSKSLVIKDFHLMSPTQKDSTIDYLRERTIIIDTSGKPLTDSLTNSSGTNFIIRSKSHLSSSKSGTIIQFEDMIKIVKDTSVIDSLKNNKDE